VPSQEAIYGFEGAYAIRLVVESVRTLVKVHELEPILCRCPARLGTKVGVLLESDFLIKLTVYQQDRNSCAIDGSYRR
jgi:hypothetical protein